MTAALYGLKKLGEEEFKLRWRPHKPIFPRIREEEEEAKQRRGAHSIIGRREKSWLDERWDEKRWTRIRVG